MYTLSHLLPFLSEHSWNELVNYWAKHIWFLLVRGVHTMLEGENQTHAEIELWPQFTMAFNPCALPCLWNKVLYFLRVIWGTEAQKCHTSICNKIIILENVASSGLCPFLVDRKTNSGLNLFSLCPCNHDTFLSHFCFLDWFHKTAQITLEIADNT